MKSPKKMTSLVLTGGGARGAYQVGVIQALTEITYHAGIKNPFPIISGASAGAINAAYLAAYASNMRGASKRLAQMWANIHSDAVYEIGIMPMFRIAFRIILEISTGGLLKKRQSRSLLDTTPLRNLLTKIIPFHNIQKQIKKKNLHGISIQAIDYSSGVNFTFFQGHSEIEPWIRSNRKGIRSEITVDHVLASTALPILFPPVLVGKSYFGDGNLRNYTPLSPSIKMGADKILVIGVRKAKDMDALEVNAKPTLGRMLSVVLNAILLDNIELDYERLSRVNSTIKKISNRESFHLKPIEAMIIQPSEDLAQIAAEEAHHLPASIKYLIKGLGSRKEASDLISNILFEPSYTQRIMLLGYTDAMRIKDDIIEFLKRE